MPLAQTGALGIATREDDYTLTMTPGALAAPHTVVDYLTTTEAPEFTAARVDVHVGPFAVVVVPVHHSGAAAHILLRRVLKRGDTRSAMSGSRAQGAGITGLQMRCRLCGLGCRRLPCSDAAHYDLPTHKPINKHTSLYTAACPCFS